MRMTWVRSAAEWQLARRPVSRCSQPTVVGRMTLIFITLARMEARICRNVRKVGQNNQIRRWRNPTIL